MFILINTQTLAVLESGSDWNDFRQRIFSLFPDAQGVPLPQYPPISNLEFSKGTILVADKFADRNNPNYIENMSVAQIISTLQTKLGGGKITLTYVT